MGKSIATVKRWISLLALPADIQEEIDYPDSFISVRHIEYVSALKDQEAMKKVLQMIKREHLTTRETIKVVAKFKKDENNYAKKIRGFLRVIDKIAAKIDFLDDKEREEIKILVKNLADIATEILQKL